MAPPITNSCLPTMPCKTGTLLDLTGGYLVGPYPEARQCGGTEGVAERDVGGVAATRDQHPADARGVVARVEGMPLPAEEHLEPARQRMKSATIY